MSNILVTAIGSFSADIVIKNLRKAGHRIIGCDIYPEPWIANSLDVDVFYQSPYASEKEKYIGFIKNVCECEMVEYLIPLTDVEVDTLNQYRGCLENLVICMASEKTVNICRNKYVLYNYLKKDNLECLIPTKMLSEVEVKEQNYPVVVKPLDGRSSQGLKFLDTSAELEYFIINNKLERYIIQPKLEGNIITVDIIRNEDFFVAVSRRELLRTLNGAGTSVEVFQDENLVKICKNIADVLDIYGCVNFEFIQTTNGEFKFLECNPRFSGGVAFSCIAGYNYILNHLRCFSNEKLDELTRIKGMIIARKYQEYITEN